MGGFFWRTNFLQAIAERNNKGKFEENLVKITTTKAQFHVRKQLKNTQEELCKLLGLVIISRSKGLEIHIK